VVSGVNTAGPCCRRGPEGRRRSSPARGRLSVAAPACRPGAAPVSPGGLHASCAHDMSRTVDRIMYVERGGGLVSPGGRIARVRMSKTQRTLYLGDLALQSLNGRGYKTNHFDVATGEEYWVSRPRVDGNDPLYPGVVAIDDDVRVEYWCGVRRIPEFSGVSSFRAPGKHSKRRPHPHNFRRRRMR